MMINYNEDITSPRRRSNTASHNKLQSSHWSILYFQPGSNDDPGCTFGVYYSRSRGLPG